MVQEGKGRALLHVCLLHTRPRTWLLIPPAQPCEVEAVAPAVQVRVLSFSQAR